MTELVTSLTVSRVPLDTALAEANAAHAPIPYQFPERPASTASLISADPVHNVRLPATPPPATWKAADGVDVETCRAANRPGTVMAAQVLGEWHGVTVTPNGRPGAGLLPSASK
jgi:hypothetical protein